MKGVKVFAGIDIGKEKHFMSLIRKDGEVRHSEIRIPNSKEGFEEKFEMLKSTGTEKEVAVGMEPTGHYWKALGYYLHKKGFRVYLVYSFGIHTLCQWIYPYYVRLSKEMRDNSQRKTDKKDSNLIAYLLREGKFLNSKFLVGFYEELRR